MIRWVKRMWKKHTLRKRLRKSELSERAILWNIMDDTFKMKDPLVLKMYNDNREEIKSIKEQLNQDQ